MNRTSESSLQLWLRKYWPIIFLALLPLIPLNRAILGGEAIGPFDQIRQMAPWNGPKAAQPWDVLQADGVLQFYVWRDMVFEAWGKGQMPFWNPYQLAGTPLLANSQSGGFYPPHILCGILHLPTATGMSLLAWFHLAWAGLGAYFLSRRLGASRLGGAIAGSLFSSSSFMVAWTTLPSVIETVSWIPWVLGITTEMFLTPPVPSNLSQNLPRWVKSPSHLYSLKAVALSLAIGGMILAGHLQFVAYGFIALLLHSIWMWATVGTDVPEARGASGKTALHVVLATILGVFIAAPQLLAVLQYSQFSHRRNTPTDAGYTAFVDSAIQPYEWVKLLAPSIQGNPRQGIDGLPVSTYYPALLKPGANFAESAIGIGVFAALLLCFLPLLAKRTDRVWGIGLVGLLGFLVAAGTPLNRAFYYLVPGWSSTGSPGRAISLFVLAASVAAGVAVSRLSLPAVDKKKASTASLIFVGLAVVLFTLKNGYAVPPAMNTDTIRQIKEQAEAGAMGSFVSVLAVSILGVALYLYKPSLGTKCLLLAIPILSSIAFLGTALIPTGNPDLKVSANLGSERIAAFNSAWDIFTAQHAVLPPNLAALNRIHSLDGYDSLLHRDTVALLKDIDGKDAAPPANGNIMFIKPTADIAKLADAGVTEVWSLKEISSLPPAVADSTGIFKYRIPSKGRAYTPQGPAQIQDEGFGQLKIQAQGPGKLIVKDRNMPGWSAQVDGQNTEMGSGLWMEVDLKEGIHKVEFQYSPPGLKLGLILALVALLKLALEALLPVLKPSKNATIP